MADYNPGFQFLGIGGNLPKAPNLNPNAATKSPFTSSLANSISSLNGFNPNVDYNSMKYTPGEAFKDSSYQAKDYTNTAMPGFDALRNRVKGMYSQQADQAQERLQRQFAAAGGGPGNGALAKQTVNLASEMAAKQGQDMQNVDFQEAQQREQRNQQEQERAFQSGEAQRGRAFQGNQFEQQQRFTDFQRQAQQHFENIQGNANRGLQLAGLQVDANSKLAQLDQAWAEQQIDAQINTYNAQLAAYTAKHSGGLFGGGGFLGLGIG